MRSVGENMSEREAASLCGGNGAIDVNTFLGYFAQKWQQKSAFDEVRRANEGKDNGEEGGRIDIEYIYRGMSYLCFVCLFYWIFLIYIFIYMFGWF